MIFSTSACSGQITNSLDVTLADEDNHPGSSIDVTLASEKSQDSNSILALTLADEENSLSKSFDVTLAGEDIQAEISITSMSDEKQGLVKRVDVTSSHLTIEESEEKIKREEKSLIVWRLINIAAGSFLVLVFINLTAMLTILLGWNLYS